MANILDFSVNTLTPTGTDKILTVSEDSYGHETLDSIKTYAQGDLPTRLTTAEGKVTTLETSKADASTVYTKTEVDSKDSALDSRITALENQHKIKWWGLDMNENTGAFTRIGSDVSLMTFVNAPEDSDAEGPVKVTSGFDSLYPWCAIRQCKMDNYGHILAYYEDSWYSSVDGDYMTELPLTYYAEFKVMVDGVKHHVLAVSGSDYATAELSALYGEALEGSKTFAPEKIFVRPNGTIAPHAYIARVLADSNYTSKPDTVPVNNSGVEIRTNTASKGDGLWCSYDAMMRTLLVHLMAIEAGQFDVKKTYGQGVNSTGFAWSKQNPITVATENQSYVIVANSTANKFTAGLDVCIATSYSGKTYRGTITAIEAYDDSNKKLTLDCDPITVTTDYDVHALEQIVTASMMDSFGANSSGWYKRGARQNYRSNVCYRGIWDLWGNLYQWVDGFMSGGPTSDYLYLCFDQSKYKNANSTPVGQDGWINTQTNILVNNGWQKTLGLCDGVHIPESIGGGAYTYASAYAYYFGSGSYWHNAVRLLMGGGSFVDGDRVSPLCVLGYYTPSERNIDIASRFIRQNLGV